MEDTDAANVGLETLMNQYNTVKAKTTKSHVLAWGDKTIENEVIGEF